MPRIIYDVAVTLDGLIAGPDGDITRFPGDGPVVEDYLARLHTYGTAIMGRATYEFGYRFGMSPGTNPYPHMRTLVFSDRLALPETRAVEVVRGNATLHLRTLAAGEGRDIYLCGGGRLAGSLLSAGLIDVLRIKRAPILYRTGTPLFSGVANPPNLRLTETRDYGGGFRYEEYALDP